MARYRLNQVKLNLEEGLEVLPSKIAKKVGVRNLRPSDIKDVEIVRRSIDARKDNVIKVLTVDFSCDKKLDLATPPDLTYIIPRVGSGVEVVSQMQPEAESAKRPVAPGTEAASRSMTPEAESANRPVVVGFGPCGMFCALVLARAGLKPLIVERGDDVETRTKKVGEFWTTGELDTESNVQFGEGGAGTFSDGKLNTGIKDPHIRFVLETFVGAGADREILIDARPHIGTDVLRTVVKNIRNEIIALGGEIRFGARLEKILMEAADEARAGRSRDETASIDVGRSRDETASIDVGRSRDETAPKDAGRSRDEFERQSGTKIRVKGIEVFDRYRKAREEIPCDCVVLALGHSARDTVRGLHGQGLKMEPKAFSMGVRVQHPQALIDAGTYGAFAGHPELPPAYYKLSAKAADGRGVYSFCMCPGGEIVNAASQEGGVVTNGMSNHDRDSGFANSGILVDVRPEDYVREMESQAGDSMMAHKQADVDQGPPPELAGLAFHDAPELAGLVFQEKYERLAFLNGGGNYAIPETTWGEYRTYFEGKAAAPSAASVIESLPTFVAKDIAEAMPIFGRKIKGFDRDDTIIKAIESRSSSPVRIMRDREGLLGYGDPARMKCECEEPLIIGGLYPGGEGAGFAGGITSAACDGIKIAEKIIAGASI